MDKMQLEEIQEYLQQELAGQLPLNLTFLEFGRTNDTLNTLRLADNTRNSTRFYLSSPFHKPISKSLSNDIHATTL